MSVTNNLKKQVDLPVFEWLRPLITSSSSVSSFTSDDRYIYYIVGTSFTRYDTIADSWQSLSAPAITPSTAIELNYNRSHGHYGRAISSGGGSNTIELAGLNGNILVGYKIRITGGKGAGQERTITAVSNPIIKDRGVVTTASATQVVDSSKIWKPNQYRDHQVRIDFGGALNSFQFRTIVANGTQTLDIGSSANTVFTTWAMPFMATTNATAGAQSLFSIESHIATVDTNWDITPDETSQFVVLSGGIWAISLASTANGSYTIQYYDILADTWYSKTTQINNLLSQPTDISFERFSEKGGAIITGTATSGASRSLTNSTASLELNRYANLQIRITGGTGKGQVRSITANSATVFYVNKTWDTTPDNTSTYSIYRDVDKLIFIAGGHSAVFQYSLETDQLSTSRQLDSGVARSLAATANGTGIAPLSLSGIVRTVTGITSLNATPTAGGTGYLVNQLLTITTGGTGATARITEVNTSGAVVSVALESCGTGYTTGTGKVTTVSPVGGTGCTLNIISVGDIATATCSTPFHIFKIGDTINVVGANETAYNGDKIILGFTAQTFQYAVTGSPATPATFTAQSATVLVDKTKNWATNELSGKILQFSTFSAAPVATGQMKVIVSNTANTITIASGTIPTNGSTKYIISDNKPFGSDMTIGARSGNGKSGLATSGSSTTLTDTSKNWPINYWASRYAVITAGTGAGTYLLISSNSATTLNFSSQSFTVDETSQYVIEETSASPTGGTTATLTDTAQNWPINIWAGKKVKFVAGTGVGNEYSIISNTNNQLTFSVATAPDTTTKYVILESSTKGTGLRVDGITSSTDTSLNNKYLYVWRGAATSELLRYNINTEQFDLLNPLPITDTLSIGSMFAYDGKDRIYFQKDALGRMMYYDVTKNIIYPFSTIPYGMGTAILGTRMEIMTTDDGLQYLYLPRHSSQEFWRTLIFT